MKNWLIGGAVVLVLVVVFLMWKKSSTAAGATKSVPLRQNAPVSSTASELASVASLVGSGTSIFNAIYSSSTDDD